MVYEAIEVKQDGAIGWLTLNRPHVLNALNSTMVSELHDYLDRLASDRTTRVVIVRGAGRAFCAGLDLKEHSGARPGDDTLGSSTSVTLDIQRRISGLVVAIRRLPQPFIAAVHGPASGGGFALALACDVRLASASARFNAAFIRIGLTGCDMGISYTLPRAVGTSIAYELLLTGRFVDAQRALATRMVSDVVDDAELYGAAGKLAREMIEASSLGLSLTKECISANIDASSIESAIAMEDRNQALCVQSGNLAEGARAFAEKRKPHFAARA
jgi:enoyl-CoA hydratase/carnithine racemase